MEVFQSMKDDHLKKCPHCKKMGLERQMGSGAGLIFKGSGFYETDYKTKRGTPDSPPPKTETPAAKPESKPTAK